MSHATMTDALGLIAALKNATAKDLPQLITQATALLARPPVLDVVIEEDSNGTRAYSSDPATRILFRDYRVKDTQGVASDVRFDEVGVRYFGSVEQNPLPEYVAKAFAAHAHMTQERLMPLLLCGEEVEVDEPIHEEDTHEGTLRGCIVATDGLHGTVTVQDEDEDDLPHEVHWSGLSHGFLQSLLRERSGA